MGLSGGVLRELPTSAYGSYEFRTRVPVSRDTLAGARVTRSFTENWDFGDWVQYEIELLNGMPLVAGMFKFDLWCYRAFVEEWI